MDNKNKYIELKSHQYMIGGGNHTLIPPNLLQYVSSEQTPQDIEQNIDYRGPYHVFDSIKELTDFYIRNDSDRKRQLLELFTNLFERIFRPENRMQIINTRGNGLCAYNSLYMYLQLTDKQEIIKIITNDDTDNFESFQTQLNLLTKKVLFKERQVYHTDEIYQDTLRGIDDMNAPYVEPIFKAFAQMTGINILLIEASEYKQIFSPQIHRYQDKEPWDYIVLLKKSAHIMLIHSHTNEYHIRKHIYEQL